jgi:universal stress protein A
MPTQHFLVPIDLSAYADQALAYAIRLASTLEARLTLLHVMQPLPMAGVDMGVTLPATYLQEVEAEVQRSMEAALARVTAAGLTGEQVVLYGVPFQEIVDTAKARQVDLIIMGTHGRTGLLHVLLGSVAEKVVRLAPCSVLVVRQADQVSGA